MMTSLCNDTGMLHWSYSTAGLVGIILLALPVLGVDRKHRRAAAFDDKAPSDMDPGIANARNHRAQRLWDGATQWSRWHSRCLWLGYALLLGSSVGAFVADLGCPPP